MKSLKLFCLLFATIITTAATFTTYGQEVKKGEDVTKQEFKEIIAQPDVVILDVRTPAEYEKGHIQGAILINVMSSNFREEALKRLDKRKTIAVYCRSGRRSRKAADILTKEGYKNVFNLEGGYTGWIKK